jgi:hypothetical protein
MLSFRGLGDKIEYKRDKVLGKKEVRRKHRAFCDKLVTDLEHETHRT